MGDIFIAMLERDAYILAISFVRPFLSTLITYYFARKLLPNRFNIYVLISISLIYALWDNLRVSVPYGTSYHLWFNLFTNGLTFFTILYLFKGKLWKRAIVYWYYVIIRILCKTLAFVPFYIYHSHHDYSYAWLRTASYMQLSFEVQLIHLLVSFALFLLLGFLSLGLWRRLLLEKFQPFHLLLIALPIGQRYALSQVLNPSTGSIFFSTTYFFVGDAEISYHILSILGVAVMLVSSIVLFVYVLSYEKRTVIEAELLETKRVMELEQAHYLEIERQSEEMAKIRHDFNIQLTSIIQLVRAGEDTSAREMISDLSKEIKRTE